MHAVVLDDDLRVRRLVGHYLRRAGAEVTTGLVARSGELVDEMTSVALVDPGLETEAGYAAVWRLRALHPALPVVVLSASDSVVHKVRCFELGVADYVTKPFAMAELIARVRRTQTTPLRAAGGSRWIVRGGVRLDLAEHVAHRDGLAVLLTARECALLAQLMRTEWACTRDGLLAHVWGPRFEGPANVVDVNVRRLRRKLGPDVVATVRSIGYRFGL